MKANTLAPDLFVIPYSFSIILNFTAKFEIFYMVNDFSQISPSTTPPIFSNPSSGVTITEGLTPFPINFADTQVVLHFIFMVSRYGCSSKGSN